MVGGGCLVADFSRELVLSTEGESDPSPFLLQEQQLSPLLL